MNPTHSILFILLWNFGSCQVDTSTCGTSKGCVISPRGCTPNSATCLVFTYALNRPANTFQMEISGSTGDGNQYNAVAFSLTGNMENADVYYCTGIDLRSGTIGARHSDPLSNDNLLPENAISRRTVSIDGVAYCNFTRAANVNRNINGIQIDFDLANTNYHILQATGEYLSAFGFDIMFAHDNVNRHTNGPFNMAENSGSIQTTPVTTATTTPATTTILPSTVPPDVSTTPQTRPPLVHNDNECGVQRSCFKSPHDCITGQEGCMFLSWFYNSSANEFDFIVVGGSPGKYVAFAFGNELRMKDADTYFCTESGLSTATIQHRRFPPSKDPNIPKEVTRISSAVIDQALTCSFARAPSISKKITKKRLDFNLFTTSYYLLYAIGDISKKGQFTFHGNSRRITTERIDFKSTLVRNLSSISTVVEKTSTRKTPISKPGDGGGCSHVTISKFLLILPILILARLF